MVCGQDPTVSAYCTGLQFHSAPECARTVAAGRPVQSLERSWSQSLDLRAVLQDVSLVFVLLNILLLEDSTGRF